MGWHGVGAAGVFNLGTEHAITCPLAHLVDGDLRPCAVSAVGGTLTVWTIQL
jgi:hypothetical protein